MIHICTKTNKKWDCDCGDCGYDKNKDCQFHQAKQINADLEYTLLSRCK